MVPTSTSDYVSTPTKFQPKGVELFDEHVPCVLKQQQQPFFSDATSFNDFAWDTLSSDDLGEHLEDLFEDSVDFFQDFPSAKAAIVTCAKPIVSVETPNRISESFFDIPFPMGIDLGTGDALCLACDIISDICSSCRDVVSPVHKSNANTSGKPKPIGAGDDSVYPIPSDTVPISSVEVDRPVLRRSTENRRQRQSPLIQPKPAPKVCSKRVYSEVSQGVPADGFRKPAELHRVLEQQRRRALRDSTDRLKDTLSLPRDTAEVAVLVATLACIQELQAEDERLTGELAALRNLYSQSV